MTNTLRSKTLTASLPGDPRTTFDWIANPDNLPSWYGALSRLTSPIRFIRDDRARVLDLILNLDSIELSLAIRVLANGDGSEIILTLVQPRGLSDPDFQEHARWAGSALAELEKIQPETPTISTSVEVTSTPFQEEGQALPNLPADSEASEAAQAPLTGRNLYVGNLPFSWSEGPLRALFSDHGTVLKARIARLRGRGGRSRGFGFVEMSTETEAQTAIDKLHESLAGDRKIVVRRARSQESRPAAEGTAESADMNVSSPTDAIGQTAPPVRRPPSRGTGRLRRGGPPPRRPGRESPARPTRLPSSGRSSKEAGISNNSGYEIYPRNSKGSFDSQPTPRSAAPRSSIEPSPYFEDTGDFENRGNRPPRRRRR